MVNHFKFKPAAIAERYVFHKQNQSVRETVSEFLIELRCLAWTCSFGNFLEEALRDLFICSLAHSCTQKKLLIEKDLTLQKAIEIAMAAEMVILQST